VNHGLCLQKIAERDLSPFPSIPGHFVTTERRLGVFAGPVDVDHAGFDPSGDRCGAILARGLHIGCEAIDRIVGDLDGVFDIAIADHAKHRPEYLSARDRHVVVDISKNCWANVVSGIESFRPPFAAGHESRPLIALFISAKRHVSSQRLHSRAAKLERTNQLAMTKLGICVGILATVFCQSVGAQTISVLVLDQAGAQTVLQTAKESVQKLNAPSAIAVVDPAGDLLAFQRMDGVRPASSDLAIEKARTAARLQRPTAEIEDNINRGRTAFVTARIAALRGGVPIRVNREVVGAIGVAGLSMENDTGIANTAAAA
jgi:glc operon protein GlcG